LAGGNITAGVVRVGDTVRRPTSAVSPSVHRVLRHLEAIGFPGAPRFLGIDARGRETQSFHAGPLLWPDAPSVLEVPEGLARAARLVASLHDALTTVELVALSELPTVGPAPSVDGSPRRLLHGDLAPWNVVAGDEGWVVIDWDSASIGVIEWELAYVLHTFVGLWPHVERSDEETVQRLRLFTSAYGLDDARLAASLALVPARCQDIADDLRRRAALDEPAFVRMVVDGHDANWEGAARHVAERLPTWTERLGCAPRYGDRSASQ
jgi:Ser/Thr protein kinase RdoA (MazF antagonist)